MGGLPERMKLKLLEPLRYLFKDEVRQPQGWDAVKFNPWFPRRIAFTEVPSLHKGTKHKVVLNYIPASEDYPENFCKHPGDAESPQYGLLYVLDPKSSLAWKISLELSCLSFVEICLGIVVTGSLELGTSH